MVRVLVAVALLAAMVPLASRPSAANACSCVPPDLSDQMQQAVVAFRGTVESEQQFLLINKQVTFQAHEFWKGTPSETVSVVTPGHGVSCGATFIHGREYFVIAGGEGPLLETYLCSFNVDIVFDGPEKLAAVQSLGEGVPPPSADDTAEFPLVEGVADVDPDPLNVSVVALSALVAAGTVLLVARRK